MWVRFWLWFLLIIVSKSHLHTWVCSPPLPYGEILGHQKRSNFGSPYCVQCFGICTITLRRNLGASKKVNFCLHVQRFGVWIFRKTLPRPLRWPSATSVPAGLRPAGGRGAFGQPEMLKFGKILGHQKGQLLAQWTLFLRLHHRPMAESWGIKKGQLLAQWTLFLRVNI